MYVASVRLRLLLHEHAMKGASQDSLTESHSIRGTVDQNPGRLVPVRHHVRQNLHHPPLPPRVRRQQALPLGMLPARLHRRRLLPAVYHDHPDSLHARLRQLEPEDQGQVRQTHPRPHRHRRFQHRHRCHPPCLARSFDLETPLALAEALGRFRGLRNGNLVSHPPPFPLFLFLRDRLTANIPISL